MNSTHLTTTERSKPHKLRVTDTLSMSEIGHRLNRHKSTILRELSPNTDERHRVYLPDTAAEKMKTRCKQAKVIFQSASPETLIEVKQCLEQPCW